MVQNSKTGNIESHCSLRLLLCVSTQVAETGSSSCEMEGTWELESNVWRLKAGSTNSFLAGTQKVA